MNPQSGEPKPLTQLLPAIEQLSSVLASASPELSSSTIGSGETRRMNIRRHLRNGWQYQDGLLVKGKVKKVPTSVLPFKVPDTYDPRGRDVVAVRLGATFVKGNRYAYGEHFMDANGAFLDPDACPECGRGKGEGLQPVRVPSQNPFAPRWQQEWTYCRLCVKR